MEESKKNLYAKLWNIANILRGKMDADEYKNYILGFIFYRYLSDNLENVFERKEIEKEHIENREDEVKEISIEEAGYYFHPKYFFNNLIKNIKNNNYDDLLIDLNKAFKEIEDSTIGEKSHDDFLGLFSDIQLNNIKLGRDDRERRNTIKEIILEINEINWNNGENNDILGDAYEYLIGKFASTAGKKGGEFYTPGEVSITLAKLVATNETKVKTLYDPTCGSGSLLIKAYKELKKKKGEFEDIGVYGQELNHTTYNLARMNMFLHKISYENFKLLQGDTISNDRFKEKTFDIIVANPPFGTKWNPDAKDYLHSDERFSKYGKLAPRSRAEFVFVQHMLEHLDDDGLMATILPHGILFRGGAEEEIRRYIIEQENQLDALIGLPTNLFFGTGIPAIIAIFKKCRKEDEKILFIDASKGFEKIKNQNKLRDKDINDIVEVYKERKEIDKKNTNYDLISRNISLEEIKENEFNLNINRYIDSTEEIKYRPLEEIKADLKRIKEEEEKLEKLIAKQEKELFKEILK